MRQRIMVCMLFGMLVFQYTFATSAQVVIIHGASGTELLTNNINSAEISGQIENLDKKAEGYIFPARVQSRRPAARVERILTGVFAGSEQSEKSYEPDGLADTIEVDSRPDRRPVTVKDKDTIAWRTNEGILYHDPFLECATGSERIWVKSIHELCGLQPCPDCFQKNDSTPAFITKEAGGLDVATAGALLSNADFLAWALERLPIRNPGFISTQKMIIYPKMEMTARGLHQLAVETERAYRRMTWKIIEVLGKHSETDTGNISSFNPDASDKNGGTNGKNGKSNGGGSGNNVQQHEGAVLKGTEVKSADD